MQAEYCNQLPNVILRKLWLVSAMLPLSDADAGKLIKTLCYFWSGADVHLEDPKLMAIFSAIAESMERSARIFIERHLQDTDKTK